MTMVSTRTDRRSQERRIADVLKKRADARAAEALLTQSAQHFNSEADEEAYIDRMHRVQQDAWKSRGWIPAVYPEVKK